MNSIFNLVTLLLLIGICILILIKQTENFEEQQIPKSGLIKNATRMFTTDINVGKKRISNVDASLKKGNKSEFRTSFKLREKNAYETFEPSIEDIKKLLEVKAENNDFDIDIDGEITNSYLTIQNSGTGIIVNLMCKIETQD